VAERRHPAGAFIPVVDLDGRYTFYHARFHEFVTRTLYEEELGKAHKRFVDWRTAGKREPSVPLELIGVSPVPCGRWRASGAEVNEAFLTGRFDGRAMRCSRIWSC
jgi:hypothetical protein